MAVQCIMKNVQVWQSVSTAEDEKDGNRALALLTDTSNAVVSVCEMPAM